MYPILMFTVTNHKPVPQEYLNLEEKKSNYKPHFSHPTFPHVLQTTKIFLLLNQYHWANFVGNFLSPTDFIKYGFFFSTVNN